MTLARGTNPVDLFRPFVASEAAVAVANVLKPKILNHGRVYIGQGAVVDSFEAALRMILGARTDVISVNSCTSALDLALHLCGINVEDAIGPPEAPSGVVVSTPMTCTATNGVIVNRGAKIVWADIDPRTGLISPSSVAERMDLVNDKYGYMPQAVISVDWGGHLCDYETLGAAVRMRNAALIQDAAHSFGTTRNGRPFMAEGYCGDFVCFSFQAIKALTTGDGGALVCPPTETERARLLRWYGLDRRSSQDFRCAQEIHEVGYKYHMNDISAAIGSANLPHVPRLIEKQRSVANFYGATLHGLKGVLLPVPVADPDFMDVDSSWWLFTLLVSDRDDFIAFMKERGIDASPVHARNDKHPAFQRATLFDLPLPGVDFFAAHEVAIPCGWWLSEDDRNRVAFAVQDWSASRGEALDVPVVGQDG